MRIGFNLRNGDRVRGSASQGGHGSVNVRADVYGAAHFSSTAYAGRMNKLDFPVAGARSQPDGSYALDSRSVHTSPTQTFQNPDNSVGALLFLPASQRDRWGEGDYYMLETDANGQLVVEPGRNHRAIYATAGVHGKTRTQIAAEVGVSEGTITNAWLRSNPSWGATPARALEATVGRDLWQFLQGGSVEPASNWLLLERGYDYTLTVSPVVGGCGESPLHPHVVGVYGAGNSPAGISVSSNGFDSRCYVFRDLKDPKITANGGAYWLQAHLDNEKHETGGDASGGRGFDFWTQYDCVIHHVTRNEPATEVNTHWVPHNSRMSGGFYSGMSGLLFLNCLWDHNGWAENYDINMRYNNGEFGQPPSMYSHNVYIQDNSRDVDFDECWNIRSASMGYMMRPGGRITHCHSIDNPVHLQSLGGNYKSAGYVGEYTLFLGSTATSAPYRRVNDQTGLFDYRSTGVVGADVGALNWGYRPEGMDTSIVDCTIFHQRNPDDTAEEAYKDRSAQVIALGGARTYYEHLLHYKWSDTENNIVDLNQIQLNTTTVQRFAALEMSVTTGTIGGLADYLRGLNTKDRRNALWRYHDYIRGAYGPAFKDLPATRRTTPATLSFIPDDRGEGFRADTDINWSTKDRPRNGDSIQQNGNFIKWVKFTRTMASWAFGAGSGYLEVTSGKLNVLSHADAARVHVSNCGQYFSPGSVHGGDYSAGGGRLCFTGAQPANVQGHGDAEVILGPNLTIPAGKVLRLDGGQCWAGWDMTSGSAVLNLDGTLDLRATPIITATGTKPRHRQGWPLVGEVSGMNGQLDYSIPRASGQFQVAIKDATSLPVAGEALIRKNDNGEYAKAYGMTSYPVCVLVQASTLPSIRKFRSGRFGLTEPSVNAVVNLSGPLVLDLIGVQPRSYTLIEANQINGNFSSVTINRLPSGRTAMVNKTATAVTLVVS